MAWINGWTFDLSSTAASQALLFTASSGISTPPVGPFGGFALQLNGGTFAEYWLPSNNGNTLFHAFLFNPGTISGNGNQIFAWADDSGIQVDLRYDSDGSLYFTRNGTKLGSNSAFHISPNQYRYYETAVLIDPSAGIAELKIDQSPVIALSGQNTRNTANSYANRIRLFGQNGPAKFDDVIIFDSAAGVTGDPFTTYQGAVRGKGDLATGAGSNAAWSRGGTDTGHNYSQTNENPPDGDTTYVFSSTPGDIDSYSFGGVGVTGTPLLVQVLGYARRNDTNPRTIRYFCKSGSSTGDNGSDIALPATYAYLPGQFFVDPATGSAWATMTAIGLAEFGPKEIT